MVSGFLISLGILSFIPTLLVVFAGDLLSDSFYFALGSRGRRFLPKIKFLRITDERLNRVEKHFEKYPGKTLLISKASYGLDRCFSSPPVHQRWPTKNSLCHHPDQCGALHHTAPYRLLFGKRYTYSGCIWNGTPLRSLSFCRSGIIQLRRYEACRSRRTKNHEYHEGRIKRI